MSALSSLNSWLKKASSAVLGTPRRVVSALSGRVTTSGGRPYGEKKPFASPHRRRSSGMPFGSRYGSTPFAGRGGLGGLGGLDHFGFNKHLRDIGKFNPFQVAPFYQQLMRRAAMPRIALIIVGSALRERRYVVDGSTAAIDRFHQGWLDRLLPQVLRRAPEAIWFGWQPFILNWSRDYDGAVIPHGAIDIDPFEAEVLEDEDTREFSGLLADGQEYGLERSLKLTWEGRYGNHYGEGQALTCYPYWWAHSVLLLWTMRYYERSVDPIRIGMCRNIAMPTDRTNPDGTQLKVDLADLVLDALEVVAGGEPAVFPAPDGDGDQPPVKFENFEFPDRSDTWMTALHYMEQKQLQATLSLPGIGLSVQGDVSFSASREAAKTQLRILEQASEMPLEAINDHLIPLVHRLNRLPGRPPRARGSGFKREHEETLLKLFSQALGESVPYIDPKTGKPNGKFYRPLDILRWEKMARELEMPFLEPGEVARAEAELGPQAPGKGGRPQEPLSERADDRGAGLER